MITIYCGIFFITDMSGVDFSSNSDLSSVDNGCKNKDNLDNTFLIVRLSEGIKLFFFGCIVGVNVFFFGYWAYKMYVESKAMMIKKMEKVYLIFCLCMDR